ncbi:phage tail protein [Acetobacter pomorum]|uniref:Phage tail protein n=2 Tax=Acetobacter pomorum TaxID=65959 RepID=A0A2G4RF96_9PROT|nr:phage tail protein [Acetobacter pomorum]
MSAPDVDANVSGTVDIQAPDLSKTLDEQEKLKNSISNVTHEASVARDELSQMGKAGQLAAEGMQAGMDKATAAMSRNAAEAGKQKQALSGVDAEYNLISDTVQRMPDGMETVSESVSADISKIERAAKTEQESLGSITAPDVNVQTPDMSGTFQQQDRIKEDLNDIKSDAGLVAGELAGVDKTTQQASAGLQLGLDRSATSFMRTGRAASQLAKVMLQLNAAETRYDDIVAQAAAVPDGKLDPQVKQIVVQDAKAKVDALKAQKDALIEAAQAEADLDAAQQKSTRSGKLEAYQITEIMDDAHKFFDMVLAGGNPLQALFYEVPNALAIAGGNGGYGAGLSMLKNALTGPAGIAVAAAAAGAAILGVGKYAESEQESLAQLSTHLRATRTDYNDMATSAENAARALHDQYDDISLSDSRSAVQTIAAVPTVDASQIQRLTADSRDLAAVLNTTVPDAAKTLATALEDPAKEAQELADQRLPGFNAGLVLSVQHMVQMGQQADAVSLVIQKLESAIHGAADQGLTSFQMAWRNLKDEMGSSYSAIASEARGIGDLFVSMATSGINSLTDLVKLLKELPDELSTVWVSIKSGASTSFGWLEGKIENLMPANVQKLMAQGNTADPTFAMPSNPATSATHVQADGGIKAVQSMIDQVAQEQHLNGDITSLMHAIAPAESSTGQYLKGQIVRSSAGAIGAMQVKQDNAAGNDLTDLHGNVSASAQLLEHLYTKYDGDQTLVAMAYNWGETNLDRYLKSDGDPSRIPAETMDYLAKTTEGVPYGAVTSANMRQSVDSAVSKGDPSVVGQRDDLTRSLQGEYTALGSLDKQYQAGIISQQDWAEQSKVINAQIDTTKASLANLRDPLQDVDHSQTLAAQSASALTGYDRQMVSVAQEVDQAQLSLNGTHASATQIMAAQAREQAILADEWHAGTSSVVDQTQALDKANAAYADGKMSAQDAASYVSAYTDAENSFQKGTPEFVQAMQERISAAKALTVAQQNTQMIGQTNQNNDQVAILQTETSLIGTNDDARQKLIAHMQVEQQLYRQGRPLTDEYAQGLLASTDALSDATAEYQHQQQVMDDFTGSIGDMADQLSDGVVQGFMQGTSAGMSFKSMLQGVDASVASVIARFALINPLMNSIDGGTRTTLADLGNLFGKVGADGSSADSILSGYGGENAITSSGWAYSPWEALNMKNQISTPSGSAAQSGGMFTGIGNLFSGKAADGSGMFSSWGSALSSIGSYAGMAGAAFGVGDMIYNLVAPLFAKRKKDYQYVSVDNGQLAVSGHVYKDIHGNDNVLPGLQSDLDSINNAFDYTGVSATNTDTIGKVGWSKKGKSSKTYSLTDLLPDLDLTSSDATMQQELKQLMPTSFDSVDTFTQDLESLKSLADELDSMKVSVSKFDDSSHVTVDHFNDYTGDMAKALSTLDGKTLSVDDLQSQFEAIEEFVGTTIPGLLDVTASGSESLMQQVDDLKQKYQDAANTAASYGLDAQALLDKGNAIAAMMIANEQTTLSQSDQSVQARYLSATGDQEGADLLNQQVSAAQEVQQLQENWRGFLGDSYASNVTYQQQLADLEKTQAAERLQIQTEYQQKALAQQQQYQDQANEQLSSVFSNLVSYAKGLDTSDASPLSVADQYKAANNNLNMDYQAAMGGNSTALASLQTDMQTYLSLSQKYNGGGAAYVADYQAVLNMLKSLGSMNTDALTADAMRDIMQDSTTTLASLLQQLLQATNNLYAETRFQKLKAVS